MTSICEHPVLILPGLGSSGPDHWQSRWQSAYPNMQRVEQHDWHHPQRDAWVDALDAAVLDRGPDVVLVAHSLACLQVVHWAAASRSPVRGALLVAVPDAEGPSFPREAIGFFPVPSRRLRFPSLIVASSDDPYGSLAHARRCAAAWGSHLAEVGPAGHINAASGHGDWPEGLAWLSEFLRISDDERRAQHPSALPGC